MEIRDQQLGRILIVEDELVVATDLEISLGNLGFQVVGSVDTAKEAAAVAFRERPDLILMDIQLHGKPYGIEAAETIRQELNIPVVFLTAYTTDEIMQRARAAGAYGFLTKPFRAGDLNAAIQIALQQHKLEQDLFSEHNWLVRLLASLSDGVIAADATGCVRFMNPAAERMTHWNSRDAIGKTIEEVYPLTCLDGTDVPQCQLRKALETRRAIPKERFYVKVRHDGRLAVEDSAAPIIQDGHVLGAVTIFLDVTARLEAEAEQTREQGRLQQEVHSASLALGQSKEELRALSGRLISAQEDERRRVARELHDDLGQRAALMAWRIAELDKLPEALPSRARHEIDQLQEDLSQLTAGLRNVSHQLHPAAIADLGLQTALRALVDQQRAQGTEISLVARELPFDIPAEAATMLYRIAQEALRNAAQHAENAPVLVTLCTRNGAVELSIEDPGPGFDVEAVRRTGGLGLLSMQERARLLGGTLSIRTALEEGTSVTVRVPIST